MRWILTYNERVMIVDGLNLFTRHYIAHPAMSGNGEQIGGFVGFFNNIARLVDKCKPDRVIVIWEGGGSKRKRDLYKDYKMKSRPQKLNRYYEDIPDTLKNRNYQLSLLIKFLGIFPITQIYIEDAEADDVIGYLCSYKLKNYQKIIISSDHDYYQLLNNVTIIWSPTLKDFVNDKKVIERFNIHPNNFCLAKCVVGDKSDNIKGVPGVGYKTLSKRFPRFTESSTYLLEDFIKDAEELSKVKNLKSINLIVKSEVLLKRNWKLVHLDLNNLVRHQTSKIDEKIENLKFTYNNIIAHKILKENAINNLDLSRTLFTFKRLVKNQ